MLSELNNETTVTDISYKDLTKRLSDILSSCQFELIPKNESSHKIGLLKEQAKDALRLFQLCKNEFFKQNYLLCRKELHKEILLDKKRKRDLYVQKVIEAGKNEGIQALFKYGRKKSPPNVSGISLKDWFDFYADLYQSFEEPKFTPISLAPTEAASKLLSQITESEVSQIISRQSSAAKGFNGTSPLDIKRLIFNLSPLLVRIYNEVLSKDGYFPEHWLTSILFFLHKKGAVNDPSNFRSLAIEDPILKIFTAILRSRLSEYCEKMDILPTFQFGFRQHYSTVSAVSLLKNSIELALSRSKKVFVCFVDYRKAFDLTDRTLLCQKLQKTGVPAEFVKIIF